MRVLAAVSIIAILSISIRFAVWPASASGELERSDPLTLVGQQGVYASLGSPSEFNPSPEGKLPAELSAGQHRFAFWTEAVYNGPVNQHAVTRLLEGDQAHALSEQLREREKNELAKALKPIDESLRELSLLIATHESIVKARCRQDPEAFIRLTANPYTEDPKYSDVVRLQKTIKYHEGVVWGDVEEGDPVYFIVRWKSWPALKQLNDDRLELIMTRQNAKDRFVRTRFNASGMAIFNG